MSKRNTEPRVAGVDPGKSGALAVMTPSGELIALTDMPMDGDFNADVDACVMYSLLKDMGVTHCSVEWPFFSAVWKKSVIYKLGRNVGSALSVCRVVAGTDNTLSPTPQEWKEVILPRGKHEKADAVSFVQRNYPRADLRRVGIKEPCHDRAEAVCLAEYGRRIFFGKEPTPRTGS